MYIFRCGVVGGLRFIALVEVIVFLGLLASPAPTAAQTQGAIIGIVTDTSGAVLPGVTVVVTGPALQVPQLEAVTNERGEYRLSPLPPGFFTITFELSGFQTVKRENLRLALGFTATVDQAMGLGTVQETVTVSGQSPLVDVTNPATSVDMSSESLEILPTNRDGLKAFMGTMPGVRTNLDVGASSLSDTVVNSGRTGSRGNRGRCSRASCSRRRTPAAPTAATSISTLSTRRASRPWAAAPKCRAAASCSTR